MNELARNKKAYSNYEIVDKFEAGLVLHGWEVKSARHGMINLKDGFISFFKNEAFLNDVNISRWKTQSVLDKIDTNRRRKLLLKRQELDRIESRVKEKNFTAIPLRIYISDNQKIKVEIALARGMKKYEKREKIKERDMKRQIDRDLKNIVG